MYQVPISGGIFRVLRYYALNTEKGRLTMAQAKKAVNKRFLHSSTRLMDQVDNKVARPELVAHPGTQTSHRILSQPPAAATLALGDFGDSI